MKYTISNKFLGLLVNKNWQAVRTYFYRHKMSKNNPDHVKQYLNKFMK